MMMWSAILLAGAIAKYMNRRNQRKIREIMVTHADWQAVDLDGVPVPEGPFVMGKIYVT